jgi:hypothetical protein
MKEATSNVISLPRQTPDPLTQILRQGAQRMLSQAIEAEVADYLARYAAEVDDQGRRLVYSPYGVGGARHDMLL